MGAHTDPSTDAASTGRWCTYDEAATLLGISRGGVRNLARKRCWPRRAGNDGKARICVPALARIDARTNVSTDPGTDTRIDAASELRVTVARLEGKLAGLRAVVEAERRRADMAEGLVAEVCAASATGGMRWQLRGAHGGRGGGQPESPSGEFMRLERLLRSVASSGGSSRVEQRRDACV